MNKTNNTTKQNCKNATELNFKGEKKHQKENLKVLLF